ncbi:MAG: hemerythrin family protein [Chlorobi bacterium]|nr:hemerythrin family protein [Chlorobiota bacterium]
MSLITWDDSYSVKVEEIDVQHQKLISLINDLNDGMEAGKSKEILGAIIDELVKYTRYHFETEEKYFAQINYPETRAHEKEHNDFVKQVAEFQERFEKGSALLSVEIITFLKKWLTEHIKGTDQKYSEYFNERGIY